MVYNIESNAAEAADRIEYEIIKLKEILEILVEVAMMILKESCRF